jgi:hypothetical protein
MYLIQSRNKSASREAPEQLGNPASCSPNTISTILFIIKLLVAIAQDINVVELVIYF